MRSVEQPINLEDGDDVYNFPWLYAVQVGEWGLTESQAKVLRDYLLRGGFFVADDLHGNYEWQMFEKRIRFVFPDRPIVEIPDNDPIFHTVFDLDDRFQIPGAEHLRVGAKNPNDGGIGGHWRGIYDDKPHHGVAISLNSDLGDGWEWADSTGISGKIRGPGDSRRRELHPLCDDALRRAADAQAGEITAGLPRQRQSWLGRRPNRATGAAPGCRNVSTVAPPQIRSPTGASRYAPMS